ncbi:hypothetical protein DERF_003317 [Dermatophagoides farinae]|uniref:Uncharacterized protein n=1 Tax=Dermatophagoides farinae TaxID=6954 RepID=A0A922ICC4_DERFA|nr:hypothetical protein DERF_003317 [Dermatophagoides farinae]
MEVSSKLQNLGKSYSNRLSIDKEIVRIFAETMFSTRTPCFFDALKFYLVVTASIEQTEKGK